MSEQTKSLLSTNIRTWCENIKDLKPHRLQSLADRAEELEAENAALLRERDEALALLKTMEGEPEITSHESGYQLGVKHGHEQMREIFEGISPRGGEAFLDSSLRYVIALREKIIELQSPSPQSDTLTVDSAMQVVMEWKSLEMNGWSADAIWDNLEHLLTKAAAK